MVPDNQKLTKDIFIPQGCDQGAVTGHKVVAKITDFGSQGKKPEGRIVEILGHVNDPGTDILSLVQAYGLPEAFPQEVMEELESVPDKLEMETPAGTAFSGPQAVYHLDDLRENQDRKSTRLNSSHSAKSRMPSSA